MNLLIGKKGFICTRTQIMKYPSSWKKTTTIHPITWTIYIDSDEFVTWNTWNDDHDTEPPPSATDTMGRTFAENPKPYCPIFKTIRASSFSTLWIGAICGNQKIATRQSDTHNSTSLWSTQKSHLQQQ
jgi:hypothetical protein